MFREAGKGGMCLGERQRGTVSGDGAGRTAGSGSWGRGVAAGGLGQGGCQQAWPDLNLPPTAATATRCA